MLSRAASVLTVLTFLLVSGTGAAGVRPCPHHDLPASTNSPAGDGAHGHTPDTTPASHADHDDGCACLGDCAMATQVALPSQALARVTAEPPVAFPRPVDGRHLPARHVPYLLPLPHGPPLST